MFIGTVSEQKSVSPSVADGGSEKFARFGYNKIRRRLLSLFLCVSYNYEHTDQTTIRSNVMLNKFIVAAQNAAKDRSGATAIEYGLIAAAIAVVIIGAVALVGDSLLETFQGVADALG